MNKLTIGMSLAALALAGAANAAPGDRRGADADGNRTITRAAVQAHAAQRFARADINKDGKLDAADREVRRAARFDRLDADNNGQISRDEFGRNRPQLRDGAAAGEPRGERRMGRRGMVRNGMGGPGMRGGAMADANKDGAVTQAEMTAAALQRFDRMDADKDGSVTAEERKAARDQMRQRRGQRRAAPGA